MTGTAGQSTRAGDSRRSPGAGGQGPTSEAGPLLRGSSGSRPVTRKSTCGPHARRPGNALGCRAVFDLRQASLRNLRLHGVKSDMPVDSISWRCGGKLEN